MCRSEQACSSMIKWLNRESQREHCAKGMIKTDCKSLTTINQWTAWLIRANSVKPHGDKLKIWVEKVVFNFFYLSTKNKMVNHPLWLTSSPWILLVLIKLIFVVHFCFEAHFLPQNFSNDHCRISRMFPMKSIHNIW